jgi:hypothetical protein
VRPGGLADRPRLNKKRRRSAWLAAWCGGDFVTLSPIVAPDCARELQAMVDDTIPASELKPEQQGLIVKSDFHPGYQWNAGEIVQRGRGNIVFNMTPGRSWKFLESCVDIRVIPL